MPLDLNPNIYKMLSEYRNMPTGVTPDEHYDSWIKQFPQRYRQTITNVLKRILGHNYYSEARYNEILTGFVDKIDKTLWNDTFILRPKTNGNSQNEIAAKVEAILSFRGLKSCTDISVCKRCLYLDDFSFTGERLFNDLAWCNSHMNLSDKRIYAYFLVAHSSGMTLFQNEARTKLRLNAEIAYDRLVENDCPNAGRTEIFWPSLNSYYDNTDFEKILAARGIYTSQLRKDSSSIRNVIFPNETERKLVEEILFIESSRLAKNGWKPLGGFGRAVGWLGFGSTLFSYRNASNDLPLAFWWSLDNWYPLVPRTIYAC